VAQDLPVNPIQASCLMCGAAPSFQGAPWIAEFGFKLLYSTYLDGSQSSSGTPNGIDRSWSIALDSAGNAYIAGQTSASDSPTLNAVRPSYGGGQDACVAKLNPTNLPSLVLNPPRLIFPDQAVGTASKPL
jgi:beta-propeller repeat-containing protein